MCVCVCVHVCVHACVYVCVCVCVCLCRHTGYVVARSVMCAWEHVQMFAPKSLNCKVQKRLRSSHPEPESTQASQGCWRWPMCQWDDRLGRAQHRTVCSALVCGPERRSECQCCGFEKMTLEHETTLLPFPPVAPESVSTTFFFSFTSLKLCVSSSTL